LSGFDLAGVFGTDIMPEQIVTIFNSETLRRKIIEKFNLYQNYEIGERPGKLKLALMQLSNDIVLKNEEVGKMGISRFVSFSLNAYHTSPDTSFQMVSFIFSQIDSVIKEISSDRGRRDRIFVEQQLAHAKSVLDSIQDQFQIFQIANKAYNVPEQVGVALKSYGQIRASIMSNEIQIRRLQSDYNSNYPGIASLEKTNRTLNEKLQKMEKLTDPDIMVGLEVATELAPQYANFIRNIEIQNELILLMTQEYEQAKLKEVRDVSQLKIIDQPYVPDYKARPKRIFLVATIVTVYMFLICGILLIVHFYKTGFAGSETYNRIVSAIRNKKK
jgi:capsule polysaccharide export protein KpsE/RkpR